MGFVIYLFGPSAAGKSTTADILKSSINNLDVIDFDIIKRQIPHYDWEQHAYEGRTLTIDKLKLDGMTEDKILLLMPSSKNKDEYELIQSIAQAQNKRLINVRITAPNEILIERYKERLSHIDPSKKDWKFKTLDEFITKIQEPYFVPDNATTFDSSTTTAKDIARRIIELTE